MRNDTYLYTDGLDAARRSGQIALWRASHQANIACKKAIEDSIRQGFDGVHLKEDCAKEVLEEFGFKRVNWVLANTIQEKSGDGRFRPDNRSWAQRTFIPEDMGHKVEFIVNSHSEVVNGFVNQVREAYQKLMLNEESYRNALWKDHCGEKSLMLSIILDDQYIGYCGIKNTAQEPWEIAIELYKKWTNHGLGRIAISAMLDAMVIRLGVRQFRVRIDPSNHASQKLFEKMGAQPNGVSEYLILDQKELEKVEKENLNLIDAATVALADKFGVEPRKLLSHVLEYTLSW